jgi:hypothetical protein
MSVEQEIRREIYALEKEVTELVIAYRQELRNKNKDRIEFLQKRCEEEIGHSWRSTGFNITHEVEFFRCTTCRADKSLELE